MPGPGQQGRWNLALQFLAPAIAPCARFRHAVVQKIHLQLANLHAAVPQMNLLVCCNFADYRCLDVFAGKQRKHGIQFFRCNKNHHALLRF